MEKINEKIDFTLYLVTDRHLLKDKFFEKIEASLRGGLKALHLREKDLEGAELFNLAKELKALTDKYDAHLFINDRMDIAKAMNLRGVHLAENSVSVTVARSFLGRDFLIGKSTHSIEGAIDAEKQGADFITFSPIYETPSKMGYGEPQGIDSLKEVCAKINIPVFALGGVTEEKIEELTRAGAKGVSLIREIFDIGNTKNIDNKTKTIINKIKETKEKRK